MKNLQGLLNTSNEHRDVDMGLTVVEGQAGHCLDWNPIGDLQWPEGRKKCKYNKGEPRLTYDCIENVA